jgi:hypothetical protein
MKTELEWGAFAAAAAAAAGGVRDGDREEAAAAAAKLAAGRGLEIDFVQKMGTAFCNPAWANFSEFAYFQK